MSSCLGHHMELRNFTGKPRPFLHCLTNSRHSLDVTFGVQVVYIGTHVDHATCNMDPLVLGAGWPRFAGLPPLSGHVL